MKGVHLRDHFDAGDIVAQGLRIRAAGADEFLLHGNGASAEERLPARFPGSPHAHPYLKEFFAT